MNEDFKAFLREHVEVIVVTIPGPPADEDNPELFTSSGKPVLFPGGSAR